MGKAMAKKGKDSARDLLQAVFNGGFRAAKLFDRATGGCRLDGACEYLLTSGIFERLAQRNGAVLLEVPVAWANREAGAVRCGRPGKEDRRNGRYDLVHYWVQGKPRAAIEVKSPIRNCVKSAFHGDFMRLTNTLKASSSSTYQFGAFVFFATKNYSGKIQEMRDKKKDAKVRLDELMINVETLALDYVGSDLLRRCYSSKTQYSVDEDEGAWQLGMVVFASKGKAGTFPKNLEVAK